MFLRILRKKNYETDESLGNHTCIKYLYMHTYAYLYAHI